MSSDTASALTDLDTHMRDLTDDEARTIREVAERVKARGSGYDFDGLKHLVMASHGKRLSVEKSHQDGYVMFIARKQAGYTEGGLHFNEGGVQRLRAICDLYLAGRFDEAAEVGGGSTDCAAYVNDSACDCAVIAAPDGSLSYAAALSLDGLPLETIGRKNAMYLEADQAETIGRALLACAAKKREG